MSGDWQYHLVKGFSKFLCFLPYPAVCLVGRGIGYLYYRIAARPRRRGIAHAMQGLGLSRQEADKLIHRLFSHLGLMLAEFLYTPALTAEKIASHITVEGLENLRRAVDRGRGVVLLTAHLGNWEWMGTALAHAGFPMTTIAKPQPNAQFTRILNEYRAMAGLEVFNRGTSDMFKVVRALKNGKVLGFLADQDGGREGVFVDFLGKKASTPLGPAILANKYGASIVPAFTFRCPEGGHRVVIDPPFEFEHSGDVGQDLYRNTAKMAKIIEDRIRAHPEGWLWFQRRWDTPYKSGQADISPPHLVYSAKPGH